MGSRFALLLGLSLCNAACSGSPGIHGGRTNVVLIVIDTLRADHLGAYGYEHDTSPNLDRMAAEGVLFERFFSTSSWTRPGMATLFTGHFPRTLGLYREKYDRLPEEAQTLAERLGERGYHTIGLTSNPNLNAVFGFAQGFDAHLDAGVVWLWMEAPEGTDVFSERENNLDDARAVTDRALAALDHEVTADEPFYLRVVYIDPHVPYAAPRNHEQAVARAGSPIPSYDGEVHFADAQIGRLLEGLEQRGLLEDTLVVVTSDHGEGLGSHPGVPQSRGHGTTLYDSTTHIPLLFLHPALPKGRRVDALVSSIHLVPTLLDLLGWPIAASELPGISVAPLVTGARRSPDLPEAVFSETEWRRTYKLAVRTEEHRFVRNDDCAVFQSEGAFRGRSLSEEQRLALSVVPPLELYATGADEDLPRNGAGIEAATVERLKELLAAWEQGQPRAEPINREEDDVLTLGDGRIVPLRVGAGADVKLDPDTLERLRALGYME